MRAFLTEAQSLGAQAVILLAGMFVLWVFIKQCAKVYRNMEGLRQRNAQARQAAISAIPTVRTGECIEPFLARSVAPAWVNVVLLILVGVGVICLIAQRLLEY